MPQNINVTVFPIITTPIKRQTFSKHRKGGKRNHI